MEGYGRPATAFRKSTFCASGGVNCVEVAFGTEDVCIRDSKNPDGPTLKFTSDEWAAFIAGVNAGEFGQVGGPVRGPVGGQVGGRVRDLVRGPV
ncbi:MAG TPA: DUF397 domain-containing protein [Streptosporangiaceae bacterium]|nr:DUF397 domain-containing protein [Streptosporangiaceae bacterium]